MQSTHLRLSDDIAEMRTAIKLNDRQAAANFSLYGPTSIDQTPSQPGTAVWPQRRLAVVTTLPYFRRTAVAVGGSTPPGHN